MNEVSKCAEINRSFFDNLYFPLEDINIEIWVLEATVRKLLLRSILNLNTKMLRIAVVDKIHCANFFTFTIRNIHSSLQAKVIMLVLNSHTYTKNYMCIVPKIF